MQRKNTTIKILCALAITPFIFIVAAAATPLKIYILAGQSNMEGHAKIETFDYIGDDPKTAPLLKEMRGANGKPLVCDKVWISFFTGRETPGEGFGKLTAGYGSRDVPAEDGGKIGPEFSFGITMEKALDEPILIIKTAWGGKSLHTDFRSPSAGPYTMNAYQHDLYQYPDRHGVPKDLDQWKAEKVNATGRYYRLMMDHISKVLKDIKRVYPDYDATLGYELAGFVWFQGWNDMVDSHTYPNGNKPGAYDRYSDLLAHFIRDVRKDLSAPKMPFVIGVMGVGGVKEEPDYFRQAMAAPAAMPEFKGNVVAVQTAPYWEKALGDIESKHENINQMAYFLRSKHKDHANKDGEMTREEQQAYLNAYRSRLVIPDEEALWKRGASNAGYHYLGCAKTMAQIGKAFAEAMCALEKASDPVS
jgi:alpha-galactosidase